MTDVFFHNKFLKEKQSKPGNINENSVLWNSPSNIALVKYWGKYGNQLPKNASVSFTLSSSYTQTQVFYSYKENQSIQIEYYFNNERNQSFENKLVFYIKDLLPYMPFLEYLTLKVYSMNTFPHSAGIASSASSISALALCLCNIEQNIFGTLQNKNELLIKASFLARLGSGSACRSLFGPVTMWGYLPSLKGSSNEVGLSISENIHEVFKSYKNAILVIDSKPKELPSSAGHNLMNYHKYAETRFIHANENMQKILVALKVGDEKTFSEIVENEALTLHALMLSSNPGYILLHPNTLRAIKEIQTFRKRTGLYIAFTLDAGPNIHLLYPERIKDQVLDFINHFLEQYCENGYWIDDKVSDGPW